VITTFRRRGRPRGGPVPGPSQGFPGPRGLAGRCRLARTGTLAARPCVSPVLPGAGLRPDGALASAAWL